MEKLAEYLMGRSKSAFAEQIGTSPSYLSQMLSGHRRPSVAMMEKIHAATRGAVTFKDWHKAKKASAA